MFRSGEAKPSSKRPIHMGPTLNNILPKLNNVQYMSIIDVSTGYHNLQCHFRCMSIPFFGGVISREGAPTRPPKIQGTDGDASTKGQEGTTGHLRYN